MASNDVVCPTIREINTKSSHTANGMYEFTSFYNLMKKTGKNHCKSILKKVMARPTKNLMLAMAISKMDMQLTKSKFPQRMKKQVQIFSHLGVNRLFFCGGEGDIHPLVHPRVKTGHSTPLHNKPTSN